MQLNKAKSSELDIGDVLYVPKVRWSDSGKLNTKHSIINSKISNQKSEIPLTPFIKGGIKLPSFVRRGARKGGVVLHFDIEYFLLNIEYFLGLIDCSTLNLAIRQN